MLQAQNIYKTFSNKGIETRVLQGVTLTVGSGEFVILMGRSGAGKSTLLYQLSLLDEPSSGSISIDGVVLDGMNEMQRTAYRLENFGFVFQDYALIPELTAIENVMVPLLMRGMTLSAARDQAYSTLSKLGLADRAENVPAKLSGGQQQRVSIARALTLSPRILFADEPTANLDSGSADTVMELLAEIHASGTTLIMVTHEEKVANQADRIIYLDDGKIISEKINQK